MKHQYFGDVNDYLKYGLLRALSAVSGLRAGVVWMLTPDDDRPDRSLTAYRRDPAWRVHDPELYDKLVRLAARPEARNLELFRRWDLVPRALEVDAPLPQGVDARAEWMAAARESLNACPLLFFDPDNGFEIESVPPGRHDSVKYLYWDEAAAAWGAGHSLLVYQHFPREERGAFAQALRERARDRFAAVQLTMFRTPHVLFLLAAPPAHAAALARAAAVAAERWAGPVETVYDAPRGAGAVAVAPGAPAGDRAGDVRAACEALAAQGPAAAAQALAARYPFVPVPGVERTASDLDALRLWLRDGFLDRYDGTRLVFPGALRLLSALLPAEFPYDPNWKVGETHAAYWELYPTLDHVVPVSRGGADEAANQVTTSQRRNSAKAHWTLEELGWSLRPPGRLADWDGLTGWFRAMLAERPELLKRAPVKKWARLLERATSPSGEG